jgi:hypothetical protein
VGMSDEDLLDGKVVLLQEGNDAGDVVTGIDDDGFARGFVAEDGAVALEKTYGEDFVDHPLRLTAGRGYARIFWIKSKKE